MNERMLSRSALVLPGAALLIGLAWSSAAFAQPDPNWNEHNRERPMAPVVMPGTGSTPAQPGRPPSDAIVLFDGKDASQWANMDGTPTKWIVKDGYMECVPNSGFARTLQNFGDCQLHIEWATPTPPKGDGQGRGNSGVFFGMDRYELQVLDSYQSKTYADGAAGAIYGQYPPLVNVCLPPGEWQSYDVVWTAPRFDADGRLLSPARETTFQNGVLVQNNVTLTGPTSWLERAPYEAHPEKQPISLQDHGNPVRYRNIWVRELGAPGKKEFTYGDAALDKFTGTWTRSATDQFTFTRENGQLVAKFFNSKFPLFAESPTKFFAKRTDIEIEFFPGAQGQYDRLVWSAGEGANESTRLK